MNFDSSKSAFKVWSSRRVCFCFRIERRKIPTFYQASMVESISRYSKSLLTFDDVGVLLSLRKGKYFRETITITPGTEDKNISQQLNFNCNNSTNTVTSWMKSLYRKCVHEAVYRSFLTQQKFSPPYAETALLLTRLVNNI